MKGSRVACAAWFDLRIRSSSPTIETSAVSFTAPCQRLPSPGIATFQICGSWIIRKHCQPEKP